MFTSFARRFASTALIVMMTVPSVAEAQTVTPSFSDVPATSPAFAAVEYLKSKGIIAAAPSFHPADKLTRAQAAKILITTMVKPGELTKIMKSSFPDVPQTAWYMQFAEAARIIGLVDSAPTFNPDRPVTKAAFMKMLLASKKIDYNVSFSDFKLPFATDVPNTTEWFYPVIRYALASSMTAAGKDGLLSPARELTRGDMALLYYRLDMYLAGRRTQALLSQTEADIGNVLSMLDAKDIRQAEYASARAMIASRGALTSRPDEPLVKGAVKVSEGFQSLVLAYKSGLDGDLDGVLKYTKYAYASADKAKAFSPGLATVAAQMQAIAKNMADAARKTKAGAALSAAVKQ